MKYAFLFLLVLAASSGCKRVIPVPVKLEDLSSRNYILVGHYQMPTGKYKYMFLTLVRYDGASRYLVDGSNEPLIFDGTMSMLNFFGGYGWRFRQFLREELGTNIHRDLLLLEKN